MQFNDRHRPPRLTLADVVGVVDDDDDGEGEGRKDRKDSSFFPPFLPAISLNQNLEIDESMS